MPFVLRIIITTLIAFIGIIFMGVVGELYGTSPKFWTTGAFGAATAVFLVAHKKEVGHTPPSSLIKQWLMNLVLPYLWPRLNVPKPHELHANMIIVLVMHN